MLPLELLVVLIAFFGNLFLGLFTYLKNPRSATSILFFSLTISIAGYIIINYFALHVVSDILRLFLVRVIMGIAILLNVFYFLLVYTFPEFNLGIKGKLLWFTIIFSLLILPLTQTNLIYENVKLTSTGIVTTPGIGITLFLLHTLIFLGGGFIVLIAKYRKATGIQKIQFRLLLYGSIIMFSLILLTNLIFILVFNTTKYVGLLPIYTLIFVGFISYAIVRHRFLDIRLLVARTVAYVVLLFFVVATFTAWIFISSNLFFKNSISMAQSIVLIAIMLLIAFLLDPMKLFLETFTDKLFYKARYSSNELVFSLTQIMASTLLLSDLTNQTLNQLLNTMRISRGAFILLRNDKKLHVSDPSHAENINLNSESIKKLFALHRIVIFDEEEDEKVKQLMRELNVIVSVPLHEDEHEEGLLVLGEKKSGEIYSQQDIDVLEIFGPEVSVALHNAESYEEISKFNITLKDEVNRATKDLKDANEKLKALDKLKNEFVSVASHELRTPMTAIKSYLWMALEGKGGKLNEKQKYYVQRGYNSVDRLIRLVNDMLNISRIESGKISIDLKPVDIIKLAQEVVDEILPRAKEVDVTIDMPKPTALPLVLADQDKIKEVLFNLIGNSLKFTPKGGSVTVRFEQKGDFVETSVTDTGAGISPDDKGKLFQKFGLLEGSYITNQTSTHMGTGLGLYICRAIIDLHHGEIKADSEGKGKGSTFSFTLRKFKESEYHTLKNEGSQDTSSGVDLIHTQI